MGLVLNEKGIDDSFSAEVIQKAMDLSPEVAEYVVTEQYRREVTDEVLSPYWLRNKLLTIILEQLNDRGITISLAESVALDDVLVIQVMLYLRSKFDQDNLYDFFKDHPEIGDRVQEFMDEDDCIDGIINYCANVLTLDEGWDCLQRFLNDRPGVLESTSNFVEMLRGVFERVDRLGNPDVVTVQNGNVIDAYLKFLGKRKVDITKLARCIYTSRVSVESNELEQVDAKAVAVDGFMQSFEKELGRNSVVCSLDPNQSEIKIGDIRDKFLPKWTHTLEYYLQPENREIVPSQLTFAVMIATMYEDFGANSEARSKIVGKFEDVYDALGNRYDQFRDMLDNALANLVTTSESEVM